MTGWLRTHHSPHHPLVVSLLHEPPVCLSPQAPGVSALRMLLRFGFALASHRRVKTTSFIPMFPPSEPTEAPALGVSLGAPVPLSRWFADEVQSHGSALRSYVQGRFPAVHDVDDVVQESFLRMWRTRLVRPIASSRAFLFTVARNLAFDLSRRSRRSPVDRTVAFEHVTEAADATSAADSIGFAEKVDLLGRAIAQLPARRRDIVVLHKIQGLSQREVAQRLGLSEKTVENQVALAIKNCRQFFREHGVEYF